MNSNLPSYNELPDVFAIALNSFKAISLTGEEQAKYLQGQVTCDVNSLAQEKLLTGAHCNAKGKVFSAFRLIERNSAYLLLQPASSIEQSLAELKKFGVFAKVEISQAKDIDYLAIAGSKAAEKMAELFTQVPDTLTPVIQEQDTTLVYIAGEMSRYLIIDNADNLAKVSAKFDFPTFNDNVWQLLEISEGFPILSKQYIAEYVPQMLNLQAINGISFTKGCYLGQETVARMQYLGKNKRALFALTGNAVNANTGDVIEKKLGENWRKAGDVLAAYQADDKQTYIQAILANDVDASTELRIKEHHMGLIISTLPYNISADAE
ncbi:tRNA-modifying protein YgfZ [Cognaticolwellia mytili]|uniref:tRNA-modifying protein YgfZ n=1 Tax=Cognaticolwellia mytili TaxID=1888913 RepID=UPI000A175D71|nr:tRNA-modifying protein YgfZ [Cognaticolwellia mytili]